MSIQNAQALPSGYELNQRYLIQKMLSSDTFSVTYLVEHKSLNTIQVIKEYLPEFAYRDEQGNVITKNKNEAELFKWGMAQFYEEAKKLNQLNHPNIVKISEIFQDKGTSYYVMPYLGNLTLKEWIKNNPYPSVEQIQDIFIPLLEGLQYIHSNGVLHKNITPDNILLSENNRPTLIDFGSAKHALSYKNKILDRVLTPPYAPIELYNNASSANASTDLYGLSASMYQVITGRMIPEAPARINHDPYIALSDVESLKLKYPDSLLTTIDQNLAFKANNRQQSANEMRNSLLEIVPTASNTNTIVNNNTTVNSTAKTTINPVSTSNTRPSKNKSLLVALGLILLAGLVFAGIYLFNKMSPSADTTATQTVSTTHLEAKDYSNLDPTMNVQGSNTIGARLMPELLTRYFSQNDKNSLGVAELGLDDKKYIFADTSGKEFAIALGSHGSSTGIKALMEQQAQIAMSSRKIKPSEVKELAGLGLGDMESEAQEIVIGLDGIAVIVNKSNPISSLTMAQLKDIFTGKITNWSEVGGENQKINLYIRDEKSGTRDTFDSLIMDKENSASAKSFEDSEQLSDTVSNDLGGIGYIGLPYIKNAKPLAVAASEESIALMPSSFTISTEDYPLSRRLYLYLPKEASPDARGLADFTLSRAGQQIVNNIGFIDITPDLVKVNPNVCKNSGNSGYKTLCHNGLRMDTNFRFDSGSSELDNKAKQSLRMVIERLNESNQNGQSMNITLIGFTDNKGRDCSNNRIATERAEIVAKELEKYGVKANIIQGMGSDAPVGDNATEKGREKNRRVELWTVPSNSTIDFPVKEVC